MKTLRKHAYISVLLILVATIVPTYTNPTVSDQAKVKQEEIVVKQKNTETVWYKRADIREKINQVGETALIVGTVIVIIAYGALGVALVYKHMTGSKKPLIKGIK